MKNHTKAWLRALAGAAILAGCGSDDTEPTPAEDAATDAGTDSGADASADEDAGTCTQVPETIDEDTTIGPGCVRLDRTTVQNNATLTIAEGTTVRVAAAGYLDVSPYNEGSALVAIGSADKPIVFTSDSDSPLPGDWQCVHIGGASAGSEVRNVTFEYGGAPCSYNGAANEGLLIVDAGLRAISGNTFRNSSTHGVNLQPNGGVRELKDNAFAGNGKPSLRVAAPQLLTLGTGLTFADADDYIDVDTGFSLAQTGTLLGQPVPFRIPGNMEVDDAAEVTFGPGVTFQFTGGSLVVFNANLIVSGTADKPVRFTSSQATPQAGDWGCISFASVTGAPRFDHAIVEYAGSGSGCSGAEYKVGLDLSNNARVTNSKLENIAGNAMRAAECNAAEWCTNVFTSIENAPLLCGLGSPVPTACP